MSVKLLFFLLLSTSAAATVSKYSALNRVLISNGNCLSWLLAIETNNLRGWKLFPRECRDDLRMYMRDGQYHHDCKTVANIAIDFARGVKVAGDGKDIWIFDIDETALSNFPFYSRPTVDFGTRQQNWISVGFLDWLKEGKAPAVPAVLKLYKVLVELKFNIVFITDVRETTFKESRVSNMKNEGYTIWEKIIFKTEADRGTPSGVFKSKKRKELESAGYRIVGNIGDQWSDLVGESTGRTFKLPNPMYHVV